jgi:phosphoribosylformylglycinamidine synthase
MDWNTLIKKPELLDNYQGLGLPGGFTMGDQLGAGQSLSNRVMHSDLAPKLKEMLDNPRFPVYSVCNCLQLLAKCDMFAKPVGTVQNDSGKHETECWDLSVNPNCDTVWLKYLKNYKEPIFAPISHGEGRIYIPDEHVQAIEDSNLVALRYVSGHIHNLRRSSRGDRYNPNGSTNDIAGFGWANNIVLFPHFERLHHDFQRPDKAYARRKYKILKGEFDPTRRMFLGAVDYMKDAA